jgi:serine/threonine protein kinase
LADAQALIGKSFGSYTLQEMIGKGKLSAVFVVGQADTDHTLALKILLPVASRAHAERAAFRGRFHQQLGVLAALSQPNILPITDYGESDGFAYLTMPYMSNGTLLTLLAQESQFPLPRIADYLDQLASALDYAHEQGIIHRDITPTNILLAPDGQLLLADFALTSIVLERNISQLRLLKAGLLIGSPAYMAPEQIMGDSVDERADIYALGVILYQMTTGQLPFQGKTTREIAVHQVQAAPPSPRDFRPDLPQAAEQILLRALAKRPEERFARVQDIASAFRVAITATKALSQTSVNANEVKDVWADLMGLGADVSRPGTAWVGKSKGLLLAGMSMESSRPVPGRDTSAPTHGSSEVPQGYIESQLKPAGNNGNHFRRLNAFKAARVLPAAAAASTLSPASQPAPSTRDDENFKRSTPVDAVAIPATEAGMLNQNQLSQPSNAENNDEEQSPTQSRIPSTNGSKPALDIPNAEQTTEGTVKLTGAVKIVQVPVAGQPGRFLTGLLPVLPETEHPAALPPGSTTGSAGRFGPIITVAKGQLQRFSTLPQRQKTALLAMLLLFVIGASSLFAFAHPHSNSPTPSAKRGLTIQHIPDVQATLAAQSTATAQANDILSDSLSQNIHNWPIERSGSQEFFFVDGTYHIVDNNSTESAPSLLPGIVLQEPLTYQLTMEEIAGNQTSINNSFGMILYFSSHSSSGHTITTFYSFEVVNIKGGQYQFWKYDSSKSSSPWTSLWHHAFGGEFHQGQGSANINMFQVSVKDSVFTFFVNGKNVGSIKDSSFISGQVGMLVNLKGSEVAFSNLNLTHG